MPKAAVLAVLAWLALPQDLEKARADLKKAVSESNPAGVEDAVKRLTAADGKRAVEILLEGYAECAKEIKARWEDKLRVIAENQAAPKYDRALDQKGQAVEAGIRKVEALKRLIVQGLGSFKSDAAVRGMAAELKARTFSASADWTRRAGIAEALGHVDHPEALQALHETVLRDAEPQVRVAAMDALRAKKSNAPETLGVLVQMLANESWQVRSAAVATLQALAAKETIEPLIEALSKNDGRLRYEINQALIAFTGVDKHGDYAAWKAWWDASKEEVKAGTYKVKKEESAANPAGGATTFYGIPIHSRHVVFVLDRSGSMARPSEWDLSADVATGVNVPGLDLKPQGNRKIDIARWQLKRALAMLPDGIEFNLIFYNHQFTAMSESMVKLNQATRKQATEFIDSLDPTGRTNIYDPLEKGLSFAPAGGGADKLPKGAPAPALRKTVASNDKSEKGYADTVFLLSDGLPNTGQIPDPDGIIAKTKEMNRTRKVTINTIGVFEAASTEAEPGGRLLKQLADDSGGVYSSAPKGAKKAP
jgi:HEAT repeat protein